jgi:hypothetical protein
MPELGVIKGVPPEIGTYDPVVRTNEYAFTFPKTDRLMHISAINKESFFIDENFIDYVYAHTIADSKPNIIIKLE